MMEFRQSQIGDLDQIVRIAEDAKAFLRASGVSQWQRGTYPDCALFASDAASGIGWVLADGDYSAVEHACIAALAQKVKAERDTAIAERYSRAARFDH